MKQYCTECKEETDGFLDHDENGGPYYACSQCKLSYVNEAYESLSSDYKPNWTFSIKKPGFYLFIYMVICAINVTWRIIKYIFNHIINAF